MTEVPNITLALYAQTDVGMVRAGNEDNFLILDLSTGQNWIGGEAENPALLTYGQGYYGALLAVSDGMGGALAGEVASRMAVETVRDRMLQLQAHEMYSRLSFHERLRLSIEDANHLIHEDGNSNPAHRGLGATFTAVATTGDRVVFAQVGDSRAYLLRSGRIARITKDQSLVQQLIDAGQITEEEAETHQYRNVILQALGAHNSVNVDVTMLPLRQFDTLLLCSDGLSGKMHADEIARIVHNAPDLKSACAALIALANERGGEDNITVVLCQFSGTSLAPAADHEPMVPEALPRAADTPSRLHLGEGADRTQSLSNVSTDQPGKRSTQPLETPSTTSAADRPRAGRRGPTTAVFGRDFDLDEDDEEGEPAVVTASNDPPAEVSASASAPAVAAAPVQSADDPAFVSSVRSPVPEAPAELRRPAAKPSSAFTLTPMKMGLIVLFLVGLVGALILARNYFQPQKSEIDRRFQQDETTRKREMLKKGIQDLRNKADYLRTQLNQKADSPRRQAMRQKLDDISGELGKVDADNLAADKLAEANPVLEKADYDLRALENEIKGLSYLRLFRKTVPLPAQC